MFQKIAVVIYTIDPERNIRILLRHNKPFDGYKNEWTFVFGAIENNETLEQAAVREAKEEFGITEYKSIRNLNQHVEFTGKQGSSQAHFFLMKLKNIDARIILNEESIGYDWLLLNKAIDRINYKDEKTILENINFSLN